MEHIFVVGEEWHGDLCYARTLSSAISYLIRTNWINKDTEIWDGVTTGTCTLEEKFGYFGWTEAVESMDFDTFNNVFDPAIVIRIETLME